MRYRRNRRPPKPGRATHSPSATITSCSAVTTVTVVHRHGGHLCAEPSYQRSSNSVALMCLPATCACIVSQREPRCAAVPAAPTLHLPVVGSSFTCRAAALHRHSDRSAMVTTSCRLHSASLCPLSCAQPQLPRVATSSADSLPSRSGLLRARRPSVRRPCAPQSN